MPASKILICGDVLGDFAALFKRVTALNASKAGPFDMLLVAGTFFGTAGGGGGDAASVVAQLADAPLPTYFTDARGAPAGLQLPAKETDPMALEGAANVNYLGAGGIRMVSCGRCVVWVCRVGWVRGRGGGLGLLPGAGAGAGTVPPGPRGSRGDRGDPRRTSRALPLTTTRPPLPPRAGRCADDCLQLARRRRGGRA